MGKLQKYIIAGVACLLIGTGGIFLGYSYIAPEAEEKPDPGFIVEDMTEGGNFTPNNEGIGEEAGLEMEDGTRITAFTKLKYEYYYANEGRTVTSEEDAPYHMLDKTRKELQDSYGEWEVVTFDEAQVVLRKTIYGTIAQGYTVSVQDGYVAVFYQQSVDGSKLKEVTDTPLSALPEDEQERLQNGINVKGEEELMRILEDYSS